MNIINSPTHKSDWNRTQITLDSSDHESVKKPIVITIVHNIPIKGNINSIEAAVDNWLVRSELWEEEDLISYINSKTSMTGHKAMTVKEFGEGLSF